MMPNSSIVKPVWDKLGAQLPESSSIDDWCKRAGLNWEAHLAPVQYTTPFGQKSMESRRVIYRSDTGEDLAIGSKNYRVHQPSQVLDFFREYVEKLGAFRMHAAGMLHRGRKIWAIAEATEPMLELPGNDKVQRYLLMATSYDLSMKTVGAQLSNRMFCGNMLAAAINNSAAQFRVSHKTFFNDGVVKQRLAMDEEWKLFTRQVQRFAQFQMTDAQVRQFYFDLCFPPKVREHKLYSQKSADKRLDLLMNLYRSGPGQEAESARGTLWGVLNGLSYFTDHAARTRTADARLDSAWFGANADLKRKAFLVASEMVQISA